MPFVSYPHYRHSYEGARLAPVERTEAPDAGPRKTAIECVLVIPIQDNNE